MTSLYVILSVALVAAIAVPTVNAGWKGSIALCLSGVLAVVTSFWAVQALSGNAVTLTIATDFVWGDIVLRVDTLTAWFIIVVNLIALTGTWYARGYLRHEPNSGHLSLHYVMLVWMHLAMCLVCIVQNGLAFIFVWELMSLSSFLLVIYDHRRRIVLQAGLRYLVQMHISVIFLTLAFLVVYVHEGSFDFNQIGRYFAQHRNMPLFILFFVGFGFKAGLPPLHTWLPHAHPAAPSHVSGIMSGVIVKMGVYGIFRMTTYLHNDILVIGNIILICGILSGLYGILHASVQRDIKRLLAYCTVENVGLIMMGIGLGLVGQAADMPLLMLAGYGSALFHILNHALSKALLFFSAGAVFHSLHTLDIDKMGGLFKIMPRNAVMFFIGAMAIAGLPPFNGFLSEFMLFFGFVKGVGATPTSESIIIVLGLMAIALIGGLSVLTFTKAYGTMFLGVPRSQLPETKEPSKGLLRPQYALTAIIAVVALTPFWTFGKITEVVADIFQLHTVDVQQTYLSSLLARVSLVMVMFVALIAFVYAVRSIAASRHPERTDATWGCGSPHASPRLQYTSGSFAKPVAKLFAALLPYRKKNRPFADHDPFPDHARYAYSYGDWVETRLLKPIGRMFTRLAAIPLHIQDGRLQWYILYGLLFILAIILLTWSGII